MVKLKVVTIPEKEKINLIKNHVKVGQVKTDRGLKKRFLCVSGVYCLLCPKDKSTLYIGSTSKSIYTRIKQHKNLLKQNKHYNYRLQQAGLEHGLINFRTISLLLLPDNIVTHDFLLQTIEYWYISHFNLNNLTNLKVEYPKPEYLNFIKNNLPNVYKQMNISKDYLLNYINNGLDESKLCFHGF